MSGRNGIKELRLVRIEHSAKRDTRKRHKEKRKGGDRNIEVMMVWGNRLSNLGDCYCWALVIGSIPPFSPIGLIGISTGNRFHSSKVSSIYFSRA